MISSYTKPSEIDLNALFYAGAGIAEDTGTIPQAEQDAYMKNYNMTELWGALFKLTTKQLDDFLTLKMGITYAQTARNLKWLYIAKYDAYYREVSDTNYCGLAAVSGTKTGDTYVIHCEKSSEYGQEINSCDVTMKKVGDRYLFVSNKAYK